MIDLTELTQEQRWGLQFATMQFNEQVRIGMEPLTEQQYAELIFKTTCTSFYEQLETRKENMALAKFKTLTQEQKEAILAQLELPNVLPE